MRSDRSTAGRARRIVMKDADAARLLERIQERLRAEPRGEIELLRWVFGEIAARGDLCTDLFRAALESYGSDRGRGRYEAAGARGLRREPPAWRDLAGNFMQVLLLTVELGALREERADLDRDWIEEAALVALVLAACCRVVWGRGHQALAHLPVPGSASGRVPCAA